VSKNVQVTAKAAGELACRPGSDRARFPTCRAPPNGPLSCGSALH